MKTQFPWLRTGDGNGATDMPAVGANALGADPLGRHIRRQRFQVGFVDVLKGSTALTPEAQAEAVIEDIAAHVNHTATLNPQAARAK